MTDSQQLLAEYAKNGSESAFRELVTRYLGLVYSTALRVVDGDSHLAEDVAQTVFSDLARKAHGLSKRVMLGGWLHQRTYNVAAPMMRAQRRRESRERESAQMNAFQNDPGADLAQIAPVLDEAIMNLGTEDRTAIMLCFFERRDFRSIGQALGSSENAARMRVTRALDKLHTLLRHRGVTLSAAALGMALAAETLTAAPVALGGSVAAAALASAAAGGGIASIFFQIVKMGSAKAAVATVFGIAMLEIGIHQAKLPPAMAAQAEGRNQSGSLSAANSRLVATGAGNIGIKLSGTYDYAVHQGASPPKTSGRYNFEATVVGCSWIISYESIRFEDNDEFFKKMGHGKEKGTASCDGTNIYRVEILSEADSKRAWADRHESVKNKLPVANAIIYPGDYPPPINSVLPPIWLAFASGCVLHDRDGRAKPPFHYDLATFYNTNCYCDYHWTTNAAHPDARQLTLISDGHVFEKDYGRGGMIIGRIAPPYDKGYTTAEGVWSGQTNIAGVRLWRKFEFTTFSPKLGGRLATDLEISSTHRCVITDISIVPVPQIPPRLPDGRVPVTDVTDGNFERIGSNWVSYVTTSGWLH